LPRDANHNVLAYFVKEESSFALKYDDDGEPAGSHESQFLKKRCQENMNIFNLLLRTGANGNYCLILWSQEKR
jgi:putative IMPACT (imprinted ancient) family translation regulator